MRPLGHQDSQDLDAAESQLSPVLLQAMVWAGLQQAVLLFLLALVDYGHGDLLFICARTAPAFWMGAALIALRRRRSVRPSDRLFLRWGFVLLCLVGVLLSKIIWAWRGMEWRGL